MAAARYASSSSDRRSYHVFLSFRGKDTRKGFTGHLYEDLKLAGFRTFRDDDEIERGENIKSELDKAIQGSQISIIVFSKDYASSRWCLNELVKIVERRNTDRRHVVLPVFYDVDPSDVKKQSGSFAEAFARHEKRFSRMEMYKVEQWRRALRDVGNLKGMVLGERSERHFIQEIVKVVKDKLAALGVVPFPVGTDNVAPHVLAYGSKDVSVALFHGPGGIGSTIARAQGSNSLAEIQVFSEQPYQWGIYARARSGEEQCFLSEAMDYWGYDRDFLNNNFF